MTTSKRSVFNKTKAQETIARIQQEARKRVHGDIKQTPKVDQIVNLLDTAKPKALSIRAAREFFGNASEAVRTQVVNQIKSNTALQLNVDDTIVYPDRCKLLSYNPTSKSGLVVIEDAPMYRSIFGNRKENYRISLPYVNYVIPFSNANGRFSALGAGISFAKKPLESLKDRVYPPKLPHCQEAYICQPTVRPQATLKELVDEMLNVFWGSRFHYELQPFTCKGKRITSFESWEENINGLDSLEIDFGTSRYSMGGLIDQLQRNNKTYYIPGIQTVAHDMLNSINHQFSPEQLSELILNAAKKIVESAIEEIEDSSLQ